MKNKKLNIDVLQKGDIVLTTSLEKLSGWVRTGTRSDISHAMLYVARTSVIDSAGDGVQARNVQRLFYPDECAIYAMRLKNPATPEQINAVVTYARAAVGTPYALPEAAASLAKAGRGSRKQFCSRLVARAYAAAGIMLVKNPDFCSPEDLKQSPALQLIDNAWVETTEGEIKAMEELGDATKRMQQITKTLITEARRIRSDILDIRDLASASVNQPELDDRLHQVLVDSGYLDYWRVEEERNPHRYDLAQLVMWCRSPYKEDILGYCAETLRSDAAGEFQHWIDTQNTLEEQVRKTPSKCLKSLLLLQQNLVMQHFKRVSVANIVFQTYGPNREQDE